MLWLVRQTEYPSKRRLDNYKAARVGSRRQGTEIPQADRREADGEGVADGPACLQQAATAGSRGSSTRKITATAARRQSWPVKATTRRAAVAASGFVQPTAAQRQAFGRTGKVGVVPDMRHCRRGTRRTFTGPRRIGPISACRGLRDENRCCCSRSTGRSSCCWRTTS